MITTSINSTSIAGILTPIEAITQDLGTRAGLTDAERHKKCVTTSGAQDID